MKKPRKHSTVTETDRLPERGAAGEFKPLVGARIVLDVTSGSEAGRRREYRAGRVVIGRGDDVDLPLDDAGVSRKHAAIEAWSREQVFLRDLASTNGTYVNGNKVSYVRIKNGDVIEIGSTSMTFSVEIDPTL